MQKEDRWFDLFHRPLARPLSRRDFIRVGRDVAACIALSSLPASAATFRPRARANPFLYGVASGDPLDTSVVLWTRLDPLALGASPGSRSPIPVEWELAADDSFRRIISRGSVAAVGDLGHSIHIEATGLEAGREYWYRFVAGGERSPVGRTLTAPRRGAMQGRFRFGFASCQNFETGYFTAYRHLVAENPDLIVFLGDYIYERTYGTNNIRQHGDAEIFTLDQYRTRYGLYRTDPDLQLAHAHCPWLVTPDDHEVENNYAGAISEDNLPPDQFLLRRAAAYQAYYEIMPLRRASLPSGPDMQLYRRATFGDLVEFSVIDTRQYRGDQPCGDGTKVRCEQSLDPALSLLGERQERWLFDGMRASRARWNVLANQIMVSDIARGQPAAPTFSMDQWAGYFHSRKRLLDFVATTRPSNPVVLTGDIHSNWVSDIKEDFARPDSRVIGAELVCTSISSGGDGNDANGATTVVRNPHIKHYSNRRGYVMNTITPDKWVADIRVVPFVTRPDAPVETKASFVVENGKPGVVPA